MKRTRNAMPGRRCRSGCQQVRSRLFRAQVWLAVAHFVHGSTLMVVLLAAVGGSVRPLGAAIVAAVLGVAPLILLLHWERRMPSAERPAQWLRRGLPAVVSNAAAVAVVAPALATHGGSAAPWSWAGMAAAGVLMCELIAIGLASRALRHPLTRELAEMDVEVLVTLRSERRALSRWLSHHEARVTDNALIITVRPDAGSVRAAQIALVDVVEIRAVRTGQQDGPRFEVDGRACRAPAGDAVVVVHRSGTWVLPVYDAQGFSEVLNARVRRVAVRRPVRR